jgi:hypothetical protein
MVGKREVRVSFCPPFQKSWTIVDGGSLTRFTKESPMVTWVFKKIELIGEIEPPAEDARYMYDISAQGSTLVTSSGISYHNVALLMQHFEVSTPDDLIGKTFTNDRGSVPSALDLFLLQIKNGGEYTPPSTEELRLRAAQALANFTVPDYSKVDRETVAEAFQEVWAGFEAEEEWLMNFTLLIAELSEGKVALLAADADEFPWRIKGPASYLKLQRGEETQLLAIGPYAKPIEFAQKASQ